MNFLKRLAAFVRLGKAIQNLDQETKQYWYERAFGQNTWFVKENIDLALSGMVNYLNPEKLENFAKKYYFLEKEPKKIGVIMAGNIPLVGLHDFLMVLLSGNILHAKLSSQDTFLLPQVAKLLVQIEPEFENRIVFAESLKNLDAYIATGSNNSSRYFEYYFSKYPNIIRKNRTSVAILNGLETQADLQNLAKDVFSYYGLGCRNVGKIYIPENYDFQLLIETFQPYAQKLAENHRYVNNYDYNKAVYLINQFPHWDSGFCILTEHKDLVSPISVLYYETYQNLNNLRTLLVELSDKIQCVVTNENQIPNTFPLGNAQSPEIWDFADGMDTMEFLLKL